MYNKIFKRKPQKSVRIIEKLYYFSLKINMVYVTIPYYQEYLTDCLNLFISWVGCSKRCCSQKNGYQLIVKGAIYWIYEYSL